MSDKIFYRETLGVSMLVKNQLTSIKMDKLTKLERWLLVNSLEDRISNDADWEHMKNKAYENIKRSTDTNYKLAKSLEDKFEGFSLQGCVAVGVATIKEFEDTLAVLGLFGLNGFIYDRNFNKVDLLTTKKCSNLLRLCLPAVMVEKRTITLPIGTDVDEHNFTAVGAAINKLAYYLLNSIVTEGDPSKGEDTALLLKFEYMGKKFLAQGCDDLAKLIYLSGLSA